MTAQFAPTARRLSSGGWVAVLARFASGVATFLTAMLIARVLDPENSGRYFTVFTAASIAGTIGILGMGHAIVAIQGRYAARERPTAGVIVRGWTIALVGLLVIVTILAVAAALGIDGASSFLSLSTVPGASIAVLTLGVGIVIVGSDSVRSLAEIESASILSALLPVAVLVAVGSGVITGMVTDEGSAASLAAAGAFIAAGACAVVAHLHTRVLAPRPAAPVTEYLAIGLPTLGAGMVLLIVLTGGILLTSVAAGDAEASQYAVAYRLAAWVAVPLVVINGVIGPFVTSLHSSGEERQLERVVRSAATVAVAPAAALGLVLLVAGTGILDAVFGEGYADAFGILAVLTIGFIVDAALGSGGLILTLTGHQRHNLWLTLITVGLATPLMLALGGRFGGFGVAAGAAAAIIVLNVCRTIVVQRTVGVFPAMYVHPTEVWRVLRSLSSGSRAAIFGDRHARS